MCKGGDMNKLVDYIKTKDVIRRSAVISDEDYSFIEGSITELQDTWAKRQKYRTETEMRVSVLNEIKFPTPAAKYWQCVREQAGFYEQLVSESFQFRKNNVKLKKLARKIAACKDDLKLELLEIAVEELQFCQLNLQTAAADRVRELRLWSEIMSELVVSDASFDTENVNTHQLLSYLQRWHRQLQGLERSKSSVSEVNNLVGQYKSGIKRAVELGVALPAPVIADAAVLGIAVPCGERLEAVK